MKESKEYIYIYILYFMFKLKSQQLISKIYAKFVNY